MLFKKQHSTFWSSQLWWWMNSKAKRIHRLIFLFTVTRSVLSACCFTETQCSWTHPGTPSSQQHSWGPPGPLSWTARSSARRTGSRLVSSGQEYVQKARNIHHSDFVNLLTGYPILWFLMTNFFFYLRIYIFKISFLLKLCLSAWLGLGERGDPHLHECQWANRKSSGFRSETRFPPEHGATLKKTCVFLLCKVYILLVWHSIFLVIFLSCL